MLNVLEVDSVLASYGEKQILTDIYLKCQTGDIIGILGRNGCGKSTLLKAIFGTLPAEKFVRINNKVCERPYRIANQLCYLPQHGFLPSYLTIQRILELYLSKDKRREFLSDPLLSCIKDSKIYQLSGGEVKYLEIKLLLYTDAKFILLDEPFNGVSPIIIDSIKLLIKIKSLSKGILLTDHDYRNVLDVANKYFLIYDGGIKKIKSKYDLVKWGYVPETKI